MDQARSPRSWSKQLRTPPAIGFRPEPGEVERLIARAREHPLGLEFLRRGALDAVSAQFQVHAFVVDSAREQLE